MLRGDRVVASLHRFAQGELEGALCLRLECQLTAWVLVPGLELRPNAFRGQTDVAGVLGEDAEKEMLGADVAVAECARLLLRDDDGPARLGREACEGGCSGSPPAREREPARGLCRVREGERLLEELARLRPDRAVVRGRALPQELVQLVRDVAHVQRGHARATLALCYRMGKRRRRGRIRSSKRVVCFTHSVALWRLFGKKCAPCFARDGRC